MAAAARDLYEKGARRSALSMYRDALDLDPLNAEAMLRLGLVFAEQEKFAEALVALKHAREFGAGGVEMLVAMGRCAAGLDRNASAIAYYEEALKFEPRNFVARRALSALGRKPATTGKGIKRCTEPPRLARTVRNSSGRVPRIHAGTITFETRSVGARNDFRPFSIFTLLPSLHNTSYAKLQFGVNMRRIGSIFGARRDDLVGGSGRCGRAECGVGSPLLWLLRSPPTRPRMRR